jgi:hypothetical protein
VCGRWAGWRPSVGPCARLPWPALCLPPPSLGRPKTQSTPGHPRKKPNALRALLTAATSPSLAHERINPRCVAVLPPLEHDSSACLPPADCRLPAVASLLPAVPVPAARSQQQHARHARIPRQPTSPHSPPRPRRLLPSSRPPRPPHHLTTAPLHSSPLPPPCASPRVYGVAPSAPRRCSLRGFFAVRLRRPPSTHAKLPLASIPRIHTTAAAALRYR